MPGAIPCNAEKGEAPFVRHPLVGQVFRHTRKVSCRDERPDLARLSSVNSCRKLGTLSAARYIRLRVATDLKQ